ncbi:MAG: fructosamine kinase family protein [Chloroflexi bacterium]|nr:fructosamine kinase family protein [Chloroflexota bacterium]
MNPSIPVEVTAWLQAHNCGAATALRTVGGGCINHGAQLHTADGRTFFLKTNARAPADMFAREAEGLQALAVADGPRVPRPLLAGGDFLLLEDLRPAPRRAGYWRDFGARLAALHAHTAPRFGFSHDNYIGSTPQPNGWLEDGYAFFAEQRLLFQAELARRNGLLGGEEVRQAERLAARLPELIPAQPASLLHGDLWGGNALSDEQGAPALIDPAAHYGWAEAELAMTLLFGGFSEDFYSVYQEARPLEAGFRQRVPIYNLYHLLNHLNLFGGGYWGEVVSILKRFQVKT